jgi:hypothetical protein
MSEQGRIKGVPIQHFLAWWEKSHGHHVGAAVAEHLESEGYGSLIRRDRPTLGVLPSVWYPSEFVHALLDHMLAQESEDALHELARAASDHAMSAILKGVYRAVFSLLATPERYPKYAQRIWNMHYDSGTIEFAKVASDEHLSSFHGWRGHHPFICMLNVQSAHAIYRAMGCDKVEVQHLGCVSRGDPRCSSHVRWSNSE